MIHRGGWDGGNKEKLLGLGLILGRLRWLEVHLFGNDAVEDFVGLVSGMKQFMLILKVDFDRWNKKS